MAMMQGPPAENWSYFLFVSAITALLMFDFGWFREQFCVIMCPYGRFQSVLMDRQTVTVMYDEERGEPRKGRVPANAKQGDCVSCNRCVQVCPTKIDIRDGVQMECISCTACIDACNEIMRKVNKPEGLIRHKRISETGPRFFRPRVALYSAFMVILFAGLLAILVNRKPFSMVVLRATDTPYQTLQDGRILNHFKAHYMNQSQAAQDIEFILSPEDEKKGVSMTQAIPSHILPAGGAVQNHFFVSFPQALLNQKGEAWIKIQIRNRQSGHIDSVDAKVVGPYSAGS